jgi:hypothetical protein
MVGGTEGADARARERLWSLARCGFLIGIAGAVALNGAASSFDNSGDRPAGLPTEEGNMKSSRFMASWHGCGTCACWSCDFLSCCAMPLGADRGGGLALAAGGGGIISLSLLGVLGANLRQSAVLAGARDGTRVAKLERMAYPLLRSSSARRMFMAINRQVRFSMRSAFGSCVFAREYSFHICVPSGSFFCISSGDSALGVLPASLPNAGNIASWSMPRRALSSAVETSMAPSGTAKSMECRRVVPSAVGRWECALTTAMM